MNHRNRTRSRRQPVNRASTVFMHSKRNTVLYIPEFIHSNPVWTMKWSYKGARHMHLIVTRCLSIRPLHDANAIRFDKTRGSCSSISKKTWLSNENKYSHLSCSQAFLYSKVLRKYKQISSLLSLIRASLRLPLEKLSYLIDIYRSEKYPILYHCTLLCHLIIIQNKVPMYSTPFWTGGIWITELTCSISVDRCEIRLPLQVQSRQCRKEGLVTKCLHWLPYTCRESFAPSSTSFAENSDSVSQGCLELKLSYNAPAGHLYTLTPNASDINLVGCYSFQLTFQPWHNPNVWSFLNRHGAVQAIRRSTSLRWTSTTICYHFLQLFSTTCLTFFLSHGMKRLIR